MADVLFNHPGNARSQVWKFFGFRLKEGEAIPADGRVTANILDMGRTFCRHCGRQYKYNVNTTNMLFHLEHEHKDLLDNVRPKVLYQVPTGLSTLTTLLGSDKKQKADKALVDMTVDLLLPFKMVERHSFVKFLKELDRGYVIPSEYFFDNHIHGSYDTMRTLLQLDMENRNVAITYSTLNLPDSEYFGSVACQYIDQDWHVKTAVLRTDIFHQPFTEQSATAHIQGVLDQWQLQKTAILVCDSEKEDRIQDPLVAPFVECYGHKLDFIVDAGLNIPEISKLLERGREVVDYFCHNQQAMNVLHAKQALLLPAHAQDRNLVKDCPRKWSTTLEMLTCLSEQAPALYVTVIDPSFKTSGVDAKPKLYSFEEQAIVDGIIETLKPFQIAQEMLNDTDEPTRHLVIPVMKKLLNVLETADDKSLVVSGMKSRMKSKMDESITRRHHDECLLTCLLCPATKQLAFVDADDRYKARMLLMEAVAPVKQEPVEEEESACNVLVKQEDGVTYITDSQSEEQKSEPPEIRPSRRTSFEMDLFGPSQPQKKMKTEKKAGWLDDILFTDKPATSNVTDESSRREEVERYLAEETSSGQTLSWWKQKEMYFPTVAELARKYLTVPASCAGNLGVASAAVNLISDASIQRNPELIDKMIFLNQNSDKFPADQFQ